MPALDRSTLTPTPTSPPSNSLADLTATARALAGSATATSAADIPTLEPLPTPWVPPTIDSTHTPVTPVPDRWATITPTPTAMGRPLSATATAPNPSPTATPTFTPTSTATAPVPTLTSSPTSTSVSSLPVVPTDSAPLDVLLSAGSDPTRTINLGEQIVFTIELKTRDNISGSLFITSTIPDGTDYVLESPLSPQPSPTTSPTTDTLTALPPVTDAARRTLRWQVQPMSVGQKFVARYVVQVNRITDSIVASASAVNSKTGQARASNAVVLPTKPPAVTFIRLELHPQPMGIKLVWQTGQEIATFGFVLLRSAGTDRANAVRVTAIIAARGNGSGATYEYVDTDALNSQQYSYWLQTLDEDETIRDYGPLTGMVASQPPPLVIPEPVGAGGVPLPAPVSGVEQDVVQTVQAALQRDTAPATAMVNQVSQVAVQPIVVSPVATPNAQPVAPAEPTPAQELAPTAMPAPATALPEPMPEVMATSSIATIEPANAPATAVVVPETTPTDSPASEATLPLSEIDPATPTAPTSLPQAAGASLLTLTPEPMNVGSAELPASPANALAAVPQANGAAPEKSGDESRGETRWGPLNWLIAGVFACFGWLIVSSFLAVAVGRYLKGRQ